MSLLPELIGFFKSTLGIDLTVVRQAGRARPQHPDKAGAAQPLVSVQVGAIVQRYALLTARQADWIFDTKLRRQKLSAVEQGLNRLMLVGKNLDPKIVANCFAANIAFVDLARREAFLALVFMDVRDQSLPAQSMQSGTNPQASSPATTRLRGGRDLLLFSILANSSLLSLPQRNLAQAAGISVATANYWLKWYLAKGDLIKYHRKIKIRHLEPMLDHWLIFYRESMPKLARPEKFRIDDTIDRNKLGWLKAIGGAYWSGDAALDTLIGRIKPGQLQIYCDPKARVELIRRFKLKPDPDGDLELRRKFWHFDWSQQIQGIVPLPLLLADILNENDARHSEFIVELREMLRARSDT